MDIRDAIFALVNVIQKSSKKVDTHDHKATEMAEKVWISRKNLNKIFKSKKYLPRNCSTFTGQLGSRDCRG
jgi:hypothetical protein